MDSGEKSTSTMLHTASKVAAKGARPLTAQHPSFGSRLLSYTLRPGSLTHLLKPLDPEVARVSSRMMNPQLLDPTTLASECSLTYSPNFDRSAFKSILGIKAIRVPKQHVSAVANLCRRPEYVLPCFT